MCQPASNSPSPCCPASQVGETYNIGTQKERSVVDVARDICLQFNRDPDSTIKHVKDRAFNDRRYFMCVVGVVVCWWFGGGPLPSVLGGLAVAGMTAACAAVACLSLTRPSSRPRTPAHLPLTPTTCPQLRQEAAGAGLARDDDVGGGPAQDGGLVHEARQARLLVGGCKTAAA